MAGKKNLMARNLVMEASAGSGKTFNLAVRFVGLVLDGARGAEDYESFGGVESGGAGNFDENFGGESCAGNGENRGKNRADNGKNGAQMDCHVVLQTACNDGENPAQTQPNSNLTQSPAQAQNLFDLHLQNAQPAAIQNTPQTPYNPQNRPNSNLAQNPQNMPQNNRVFHPTKIENILALTFTNAATKEMQERILRLLLSPESPECKGEFAALCENLNATPTQIKRELNARRTEFQNARLNVRTFDSFFGEILRRFSMHKGLGAGLKFGAKIDAQTQRAFLQRLATQPTLRREFVRLVNDFGNNVNDTFAKLAELSRLDESRVAWREEDFCERMPDFERVRAAAQRLGAVRLDFKVSRVDEYRAKFTDIDEEKVAKLLTLPARGGQSYFTHYKPNSNLGAGGGGADAGTGAGANGDLAAPPEFIAAQRELRREFLAYLRQKEGYSLAALKRFVELYRAARLDVIRERGELGFDDMVAFAHEIVTRGDLRELIAFRLDAKIEHILVDEFQDTNLVQFEILRPLIDEILGGIGQKGRAGSFFYVGDKKQSIYRFRGTQPEIFDAAKGAADVIALDANYRSARQIVRFVNEHFAAPYSEPALAAIGASYTPQRATKGEEGFVKIVRYNLAINKAKVQTQAEFAIITQQIRLWRALGVELGDIAVLCWKNTYASGLLEHLRAAGISAVSTQTQKLFAQPQVALVINLLRYWFFGDVAWAQAAAEWLGVAAAAGTDVGAAAGEVLVGENAAGAENLVAQNAGADGANSTSGERRGNLLAAKLAECERLLAIINGENLADNAPNSNLDGADGTDGAYGAYGASFCGGEDFVGGFCAGGVGCQASEKPVIASERTAGSAAIQNDIALNSNFNEILSTLSESSRQNLVPNSNLDEISAYNFAAQNLAQILAPTRAAQPQAHAAQAAQTQAAARFCADSDLAKLARLIKPRHANPANATDCIALAARALGLDIAEPALLQFCEYAAAHHSVFELLFETAQAGEDAPTLQNQRSGGVRVSTVHKSKGLQFEYVIVADRSQSRADGKKFLQELDTAGLAAGANVGAAGAKFGGAGANSNLAGDVGGGGARIMLRLNDKSLAVFDDWRQVDELRERRDKLERLNALYVALTRAKRGLVVLAREGSNSSNYLGDNALISLDGAEIGAGGENSAAQNAGKNGESAGENHAQTPAITLQSMLQNAGTMSGFSVSERLLGAGEIATCKGAGAAAFVRGLRSRLAARQRRARFVAAQRQLAAALQRAFAGVVKLKAGTERGASFAGGSASGASFGAAGGSNSNLANVAQISSGANILDNGANSNLTNTAANVAQNPAPTENAAKIAAQNPAGEQMREYAPQTRGQFAATGRQEFITRNLKTRYEDEFELATAAQEELARTAQITPSVPSAQKTAPSAHQTQTPNAAAERFSSAQNLCSPQSAHPAPQSAPSAHHVSQFAQNPASQSPAPRQFRWQNAAQNLAQNPCKLVASSLFGEAVHYFLQMLDGADGAARARAADALRNRFGAALRDGELAEVLARAHSVAVSAEFGAIFAGARRVWREFSLVYDGAIVRLDALVERAGEVVLLDYKTGRKSAKNAEQIARYREILRGIFGGRVRAIIVYVGEGGAEFCEI